MPKDNHNENSIIKAMDSGKRAFIPDHSAMNPYFPGSRLAEKWLEGYLLAAEEHIFEIMKTQEQQ